MFILFFILWVIFNGQLTLEIAAFGVCISAAVYAFCCFFMDFSFKKDVALVKKTGYFIMYVVILVREIIKANLVMMKYLVIKQEYELHPVIFKLETNLKSKLGRVLLANAITLTPGTITVSVENDALIIHALDESLIVESDGEFVFERILLKLEGGSDK